MSDLAQQLIQKAKLEASKRLDLGNCGLTEFPAEVLDLVHLEELSLSGGWPEWNEDTGEMEFSRSENNGAPNLINALPSDLGKLKYLRKLILDSDLNTPWQLADISPISKLVYLEVLRVDENQITDISPLANLINLREVSLRKNPITDFSPLSKLHNLRSLELYKTDLANLDLFQDLLQLRQFSIGDSPVSDISGLGMFKKLRWLYIGSELVEDLSPIGTCTELTRLGLAGKQIKDISFITNLKQLSHFNCFSTAIVDFSALSGISSLRSLDIHSGYQDPPIKEETIPQIPGLIYLELRSSGPLNLEFLYGMPNLKELQLGYIKTLHIRPIGSLKHLEKLELNSATIDDLTPLANCPKLQHLNLSWTNVEQLDGLSKLSNLNFLNLHNTPVSNIGPLSDLKELRYLDISMTSVSDLTPLAGLNNLEQLFLRYTQVSDLSPIVGLKAIKSLTLYKLKFKTLNSLADFTHLESLSINQTEVTDLSPISKLTQLRELGISDTKIMDLAPISGLTNLTFLSITQTGIKDLSPIKDMLSLGSLYAYNTQIEDISPLSELKNLKLIAISRTPLKRIKVLEDLPQIEEVSINGTLVTDFTALASLHQLREFSARNTRFDDLTLLRKSISLEKLSLGKTAVQDFSELSKFRKLKELSLRTSNLKEGYKLLSLKELEKLDIGESKLNFFPKELAFLPKLQELILYDNPIRNIPASLFNDNKDNVLKDIQTYFTAIEQNPIPDNLVKIILLGNGVVGKSALAQRLLNPEQNFRHIPLEDRTHGIKMENWTIPGTEIPCTVWDFGGQEIYHATHRPFLSQGTLYLLLWTQEPLEEDEETKYPLSYWLDFVADVADDSQIVVIQNMTDLHGFHLPENWSSLVADYATKGLHLENPISISCKADQNIELLRALIKDKAQKIQQNRTYQLPFAWGAVRSFLHIWRERGNDTLKLSDFHRICEEVKIDHNHIPTLLNFLHNSGDIFYQRDVFGEVIILNQQWAINSVYILFDKNKPYLNRIQRQGGRFRKSLLFKIWSDLKDVHFFLDFMKSCEICYPVFNNEYSDLDPEYLIPQLLPSEEQTLSLLKTAQYKYFVRLIYPYLHRLLVNRFLVHTNRLGGKFLWKNGTLLNDEVGDANALVFVEEEEYAIYIFTTGKEAYKLLDKIRNTFDDLGNMEKVQEEVSIDGQTFIPISEISRNSQLEVFMYEGKQHLTKRYRRYLQRDPSIRFFANQPFQTFLQNKHSNLKDMHPHDAIKRIIARGELEEALNGLLTLYPDGNGIITLSGHLHSLQKSHRNQTITDHEWRVERNKLSLQILELLEKKSWQ